MERVERAEGVIKGLTEDMIVEATLEMINRREEQEAKYDKLAKRDRRDMFAAAALTGFLSKYGVEPETTRVAVDSAVYADALIKVLDE